MAGPKALPDGPERGECRSGVRGPLDEPADRHQATDVQALQGKDLCQRLIQGSRLEPGLCLVVVDVDLEEYRDASAWADLGGEAVDTPGEFDRIDGLDRLEDLEGPTNLVRLERTDEVPRRAGDGASLRLCLLNPVLAERRQAGGNRRDEALGGHGLRDGDKGNGGRIAPHPSGGIGYSAEDPLPGVA